MKPEDYERLQDMLAAARDALSFSEGRTKSDLTDNRMFFLALVKAVEIIGEAAARVSPEAQERYPQIAWSGIIGMRNILVHAYGSIDVERLWETVQHELPSLAVELERIVEEDKPL